MDTQTRMKQLLSQAQGWPANRQGFTPLEADRPKAVVAVPEKNRGGRPLTGFTLLELLAVLFIIGIILSIAVPTLGPTLSKSKLSTASENLANVLETARQYAKTNDRECYVVFPITGDMAYSAYKIYDNVDKKSIGKLETLPKGIKIDNTRSNFMTGTPITIKFPEDNSSEEITPAYLKFKTSGSGDTGASVYLKTEANASVFRGVTISASPCMVRVLNIGETKPPE